MQINAPIGHGLAWQRDMKDGYGGPEWVGLVS